MPITTRGVTGITVSIATVLCISLASPVAGASREEDLITVGSISTAIKDEAADFRPLVDFLVQSLAHLGVKRGRVVVAQSIEEMADLIRSGKVDLYIDSPFPVVRVSQLAGIQPIAVRWKKGVGEYHSVIFSREDGPVDTLDDLKGRMVAFDDPHSTSGFLLPVATLAERRVGLREYLDPSTSVAPDSVGYVFSGDDENTVFWVLKGLTAAGAMDNVNFIRLSGNRIDRFKILFRTTPVPRQLVACPSDLDPNLRAELKSILLRMHNTEEGRSALLEFQETAKFEALLHKAQQSLETVETLIRVLDESL